MRLLNVKSRRLEEFFNKPVPEYAILSHTWGENEIVYQDFQQSDHLLRLLREVQVSFLSPTQLKQKPAVPQSRLRNETTLDSLKPYSSPSSYVKIDGCCDQALKNGYSYVWIDTVCIDKSSSAELSEAINSMYKWYANARVCYVYLSDVDSTFDPLDDVESVDFRKSRWFTRGWTLQELLAPWRLEFFTSSWSNIAVVTKPFGIRVYNHDPMLSLLTTITKIPRRYLKSNKRLQDAPVCQRMAWAAHRQTTRPEDEAYCLLGLFDINMPLLYGEGTKAFMRLQHQLMQVSADDSLFCWGLDLFHSTHEVSDWSGASRQVSRLVLWASWYLTRGRSPAPDSSLHAYKPWCSAYATTHQVRREFVGFKINSRPIERQNRRRQVSSAAPPCCSRRQSSTFECPQAV